MKIVSRRAKSRGGGGRESENVKVQPEIFRWEFANFFLNLPYVTNVLSDFWKLPSARLSRCVQGRETRAPSLENAIQTFLFGSKICF